MRLSEAEKDQRRRDQARVLRELHRSATVFRDVTSLPARKPLDATSMAPTWDGEIRPGAICTVPAGESSPFWTLAFR